MELLDMKCAEKGKEIVDKLFNSLNKDKTKTENLITKSLGVLQEDGVYAYFLYISSLKNNYPDAAKQETFNLLKQNDILKEVVGSENDILKALRDNFDNKLDELLFAKELLERTLVYARYHAKALDNPKTEKITDNGGV